MIFSQYFLRLYVMNNVVLMISLYISSTNSWCWISATGWVELHNSELATKLSHVRKLVNTLAVLTVFLIKSFACGVWYCYSLWPCDTAHRQSASKQRTITLSAVKVTVFRSPAAFQLNKISYMATSLFKYLYNIAELSKSKLDRLLPVPIASVKSA